jgi:hypothetical protein
LLLVHKIDQPHLVKDSYLMISTINPTAIAISTTLAIEKNRTSWILSTGDPWL